MTAVGRRSARALVLLGVAVSMGCNSQTTIAVAPLDLLIGAGDGQFGVIGSQLPTPLRAVVVSATTGQPRRNVSVLWDVTEGGASLVGATTNVTDSTGSSEIRVRLGSAPGQVGVRARVADQPNVSVEFQLFAVSQPTLSDIEPESTVTGDTVRLTGTSFSPVPEQNVVLFAGVRGRVVAATSTTLDVVVPRCLPARDLEVHMQLGSVASADTLPFVVTGGTLLESMQVGEVIDVADDAGFACYALPGTSGATYLTVVYSASTVGAALHPYRLAAVASSGPLPAPSGDATAPVSPEGEGVALDPQTAWDHHVRGLEGELIRARTPGDRNAPAPSLAAPLRVPTAGERRTFNVLNPQGGFDRVGAVAEWVSSQAAIFVDTLSPPGGFNLGEIATFASRFDQVIHPQVTSVFGGASDLDANQRVVVLFTPAVNRLTPRGAAGFVGGFFYGVDLLPTTTGSNSGEVFYALVPDPTGIHSSPRQKADVARAVPAILAHEYQHMVHFNERILVRGAPAQESLWMSEALAQMAEEVVARAYQWLGDSASDSLFRSGTRQRARLYLQRVDSVSLLVTTGQGSLAERGAGFLHLLYLDDRIGNGILGRLTRTTRTGVTNVEAETGLLWEDLVADWWSAVFLDGFAAPPLAYPTVDLRAFLGNPYPVLPAPITGAGLGVSGSLWSSAAKYYMVSPGLGASVTLRLGGVAGGPSPAQSVLRMRIIRVS
ncbi:MAG: IPT/TIG domain-containing protein [Longimicrobiales bacterium]